jgi:hypothetical protein
VHALPVALTGKARGRKYDTDLGNRLALPGPPAWCRHLRRAGWVMAWPAAGGLRGEEDEQA